jgi:hypothetical protein
MSNNGTLNPDITFKNHQQATVDRVILGAKVGFELLPLGNCCLKYF